MKQQFALGSLIRRRYIEENHFLSQNYKPKEVRFFFIFHRVNFNLTSNFNLYQIISIVVQRFFEKNEKFTDKLIGLKNRNP